MTKSTGSKERAHQVALLLALTLTRGIPYPMCSEAKHWVGMDSGPSVSSAFLAPGYIV